MANVMEKISETVRSLSVKTVYGDPVTLDGVEVVPVALVYFGFGGGGDNENGEGGGGGGGAIPVGAYVSGPDGPVFRPNVISLIAVLIPFSWVAGKALARIIRALKK